MWVSFLKPRNTWNLNILDWQYDFDQTFVLLSPQSHVYGDIWHDVGTFPKETGETEEKHSPKRYLIFSHKNNVCVF